MWRLSWERLVELNPWMTPLNPVTMISGMRIGACAGPEEPAAHDAQRPGGVQESGIIAALALDDRRRDSDVRELLEHVHKHAYQRR
jgi:hypothetical protein